MSTKTPASAQIGSVCKPEHGSHACRMDRMPAAARSADPHKQAVALPASQAAPLKLTHAAGR